MIMPNIMILLLNELHYTINLMIHLYTLLLVENSKHTQSRLQVNNNNYSLQHRTRRHDAMRVGARREHPPFP